MWGYIPAQFFILPALFGSMFDSEAVESCGDELTCVAIRRYHTKGR